MRDQQFNRISIAEKPVKNKFTREGDYALIEVTGEDSYPDAKIVGKQMLYANILMIGDYDKVNEFSEKSKGRYKVIETKKLDPMDMPYKLEKKIEKISKSKFEEE